ncbi:SAM-dependent methyltransferase [Saccharicrinis fermentans]|uniref:Ribosomal RNA small subunit methyltransferase I n=1 Tax=Saccharicrinis fermentans DSM 9555 = JCM 21142 TaxID=869213 RepID=W7YLF2_9BACT|nr:SAM-dependent methyltransferase [Saccharicrinis fermentans]GAF03199.1 ribosomal RNA small subunit methyltransferase I [Saccharicrinis fermentans DSM 9555 = JCM 21142]
MNGTLYLIPTTLGDSSISSVIPADVIILIKQIKHFIVEDIRTTRRYLKKVDKSINIDDLTFYELNKHTTPQQKSNFLNAAKKGQHMGIISEAGCPGVADPGADIVASAHQQNIRVIPLVGPSSILLSVMASGMNGQSFAFHGYIPIKSGDRAKAIKHLESLSIRENQTQIFIEAPYRNNHLLKDILANCQSKTKVCVACDITLETEFIKTKTVGQWKGNLPELHKKPTIFLIQG